MSRSQSRSNLHLPLQRTAFKTYCASLLTNRRGSAKGSRISSIYMYLGGLELGALICLLGCDLSLIILQGKIYEMTRTLSYF